MSDVLVRILSPLRAPLEGRSVDLDALMASHGLSPRRLWLDPSSRIPWNTFADILEEVADGLGGPEALDPIAAAHLAGDWQALTAIVSRYAKPFPAFRLGVKWFGPAIFRGVRGELKEIPGGLVETVWIPGDRRDSVEFFCFVRGIMRQFPMLIGWKTTSLELVHRERCGEYRLEFAPAARERDRIVGHGHAADPDLDLEELLALQFSPDDPGAPISRSRDDPSSTAARLRGLLRDGHRLLELSLPEAAHHLAMSGRSLERALASEGVTYRRVRDEVRLELASTLLREGETVEAIADRLGFLDATSFHRAFRRWTGKSPGAFRRALASKADGGIGQDSGASGHSATHS